MKFVFLLLLVYPYNSIAKKYRDIEFAVSMSNPPYIMHTEDLPGLNIEILTSAFLSENINVNPYNVPNSRIKAMYKANGGGAFHGKKNEGFPGTASKVPIMTFFNKFIMKKSNKKKLSGLNDNRKFNIISFTNAQKYLGEDYALLTKNASSYKEFGGELPSIMLELNRADIIVSDRNIFNYYLKKKFKSEMGILDFDNYIYLNYLTKGNKYYWFFETKELADIFDNGLRKIYQNGTIDDIFSKYQKEFGVSREPFIYIDCYYGKRQEACENPNLIMDLL